MLTIEITHPDAPAIIITDQRGVVWVGDPLNLDDIGAEVDQVRTAITTEQWTPSEADGWTETEPAPAYSLDEFAAEMDRRGYDEVAGQIRAAIETQQDRPSQTHEIEAYLGPVEATEDQVDALRKISDRINVRYPIPENGHREDVTEECGDAMNAAVEILIDEKEPADKVTAWRTAQAAAARAHAEMTGAIIATGWSEAEVVRELGVSRPTARKALGDRY